MFPWAAILLFSVVGRACADEPPIVDVIREMIYETNQDLAKNHKDHLKLPNLGLFPWDPIKLSNGNVGVFSTMELIGEQDVQQDEKPDGSMTLMMDLKVGLGKVSLQYDFRISILGLYVKNGVAELLTSNDTARVNATVTISKEGKCSAHLNSARLTELDNFKINIQPDTIPHLTLISQSLINFLAPKSLPLVNAAVKEVIQTDWFQTKFSENVCKKLPF